METLEPIAEVIESSTRAFEAEVNRGEEPPDFGSWVHVEHGGGLQLYGLVSHVEMNSYEPNRRAVALGRTTEELKKEMPQVMELLRTTFRAQVLAYRDRAGTVRQTLPPQPAGIHAFVAACPPGHVRALGRPYDFLRTLARNPDPAVPVDDLIVAVLGQVWAVQDGQREREAALVDAGRALSRLLDDDHERLQSILRRVKK